MARSTSTQNTDVFEGAEGQSAPLSPQEIKKISTERLRDADRRTQENFRALKTSPKVMIQISPLYKPHFGEKMAVGLNGLYIYVPMDGRQYPVPKQYARVIKERIRRVDELSAKARRMSDVARNLEAAPGMLPLLTK